MQGFSLMRCYYYYVIIHYHKLNFFIEVMENCTNATKWLCTGIHVCARILKWCVGQHLHYHKLNFFSIKSWRTVHIWPNCCTECDQFTVVSISSVRLIHKIYFVIKSTEMLSLPWKLSKVTRNLVLQRFPRCMNFLDQTIFKRECCQKMTLFSKFSSGT